MSILTPSSRRRFSRFDPRANHGDRLVDAGRTLSNFATRAYTLAPVFPTAAALKTGVSHESPGRARLTTDDSREEPAKPGLELRVRVVSGNQTIAGLAGEIHRILVCRLVVR
jgi:hypothetical protein